MRKGTSNVTRVTAWGLLALMATPAFGDERQQKIVRWEAFVQLEPGAAVELALADGERFAGRLLAANAHEASVVDFTGRGLSERAQKRFVRELIKARRKLQASAVADAQATATASAEHPMVRHVTRDQVAAVYVPRGGATLGGALKIMAFLAGACYLALLSLISVACGGQCLD